jgi:DNA polymerase alpha subunit B N-terminal.
VQTQRSGVEPLLDPAKLCSRDPRTMNHLGRNALVSLLLVFTRISHKGIASRQIHVRESFRTKRRCTQISLPPHMHTYQIYDSALDDRIDEFGELIREHYNISELGDPSSSTDVRSSFLPLLYPPFPLNSSLL